MLAHLNGNQGFYNGCVWALQNPIERRLRLEAALAGHSDVLDAIDDFPLAISGNYVAFGYDGPFADWQATREHDPRSPIEDIVTLPTRGVFAEAQLGHCNACEERDPTRMSNWTEMTIETPPDIGGVVPGPHGQTPTIAPTALPGNVIQIAQPSALPDPTALAAALKVLGTPEIFRDMSGLDEVSKLLDTLVKQLPDGGAKDLAQQAKDKVDGTKDSPKGAGGAAGKAGTGSERAPAHESDPGTQVDRLKAIEYARDHGLIDDAQKTDAARAVLGGEIVQAMAFDRNISMPMGIDVSHHQGQIDWGRVADSGISFAFIKASDGQSIDNTFQGNWTKARAAGLMCGAYHFWLPQVSGRTQAETLIRQLGFLRRGDLPPVLDIEEASHSRFAGLSVASLENNIQEFLDTVQAEFGVVPIIYTAKGFWADKMANSAKFSSYPLWIAAYSPANDPALPATWPTWDFWQLTDSGRVDGIAGMVDMDWFNGSLRTLQSMAGLRTVEEA